jgi:hypothetical protein
MRIALTVAVASPLAAAAAGCGSGGVEGRAEDGAAPAGASRGAAGERLPQGSEPVELDPADFTTRIDNRYWPMVPGSRWVYRETDTEGTKEKVVVEVTDKTRRIANGVEARVVRDTVLDQTGERVEVTVDEEQVEVPFGYFKEDVLMTRDLVPTEPRVQELKFYAPGVGPVLTVHTDGAGGRGELVSYTRPG